MGALHTPLNFFCAKHLPFLWMVVSYLFSNRKAIRELVFTPIRCLMLGYAVKKLYLKMKKKIY